MKNLVIEKPGYLGIFPLGQRGFICKSGLGAGFSPIPLYEAMALINRNTDPANPFFMAQIHQSKLIINFIFALQFFCKWTGIPS
ncbi:MAG TPA: hypothetical protein VNY73_05930 [Bacteroidia bacterium]|jgi:hypothetical protein|nr:hypothetical protein [Bacteroidia bacterium]